MTMTAGEVKEKLDGQLKNLEARLQSVKDSVHKSAEHSQEVLAEKAAEVKKDADAQKQKADDAKNKVSAWFKEKQAEIDSDIQDWKDKRELKKLQHRADKAQDSAESALIYAAYAVMEAETAVYEAVLATLEAEEVAQKLEAGDS